MFHQYCSYFTFDVIGKESTQCISLFHTSWNDLIQWTTTLQQQFEELCLQQQQQPPELMTHIKATLLEASSHHETLRDATNECRTIFTQALDWVDIFGFP